MMIVHVDLIPRANLMKWLSYLRDEYPTIAFKSTTQKQRTNLGRSKVLATKASDNSESTSLGTETLLQLLKNYTRSTGENKGGNDMKHSISVGIIGFPNVGKSSLINTLKRSKVVNVGARPGVTRAVSEITLDKNITLIDCPGIIFASDMSAADAALRNCINFDQLTDSLLPIEAILNRCAREKLMVVYGIGSFNTPLDFLRLVAEKRGKMMRGGIVDIEAAAQMILHDWNSGKIPYYTIPPESQFTKNRLSATIVSQWSEAFKLEDIMEMENSTVLAALEDDGSLHSNATVLPSSAPVQVHEDFLDLNSLDDPLTVIEANGNASNNNSNNSDNKKKVSSTGETALAPVKERKETEKERKKKMKADMALHQKEEDAIEEIAEDEDEDEEKEEGMKFVPSDSFWSQQELPVLLQNNNLNNK